MTFCGLEGRIAARFGLLPGHGWPRALRQAFVEVGRARRLAGPALVLESFNDPCVLRELAGWLAVTDTAFFRDPIMFRSIARKLRRALPAVGPSRPLRIWSAGCSTGQEVYSLALTLLDRLPADVAPHVLVLGTDLVRSAIEKARSAEYSDDEAAGLSDALLCTHAEKVAVGWRLSEPVRAMVRFEHLSIQESLEQYEPRSFDSILFCDVAPYLDRATVERIYLGFHRVLEPGGHLFIGPGDSPPTEDLFVRDSDQRSFWRVPQNSAARLAGNRVTHRPLAKSLRRSLAPGSSFQCAVATGCDSQSVLRAANEAIQLRPTDGLGYLLRGRILLSSSRPEAANEDLRRATYLLDCDELAEYWYLRAAQLNGRLDQARPRLVRLIHRLSCRAPEETLFDGRTTVGELLDASMLLKQQLG